MYGVQVQIPPYTIVFHKGFQRKIFSLRLISYKKTHQAGVMKSRLLVPPLPPSHSLISSLCNNNYINKVLRPIKHFEENKVNIKVVILNVIYNFVVDKSFV